MERRFFADAMLGKLARWMRTLGYDCEYSSDIDDTDLLMRAASEGRVVLTRDTLLMKRRLARGRAVLIEGDDAGSQLKMVTALFPIGKDAFLTRCLRCNSLLEDAGKDAVRGKVPPYVLETQSVFSRCPSCQRVYWGGTHREKMVEELRRLLS